MRVCTQKTVGERGPRSFATAWEARGAGTEKADPYSAGFDRGAGAREPGVDPLHGRLRYGFADFWSNVVRATLPATPNPAYSVGAVAAEGGLEIDVQSRDPIPDGVAGVARVVAPDGTTTKVDLVRDGVDSFSATAPADAPGACLASVDLKTAEPAFIGTRSGPCAPTRPSTCPGRWTSRC